MVCGATMTIYLDSCGFAQNHWTKNQQFCSLSHRIVLETLSKTGLEYTYQMIFSSAFLLLLDSCQNGFYFLLDIFLEILIPCSLLINGPAPLFSLAIILPDQIIQISMPCFSSSRVVFASTWFCLKLHLTDFSKRTWLILFRTWGH